MSNCGRSSKGAALCSPRKAVYWRGSQRVAPSRLMCMRVRTGERSVRPAGSPAEDPVEPLHAGEVLLGNVREKYTEAVLDGANWLVL
jgi:hypothetical protein